MSAMLLPYTAARHAIRFDMSAMPPDAWRTDEGQRYSRHATTPACRFVHDHHHFTAYDAAVPRYIAFRLLRLERHTEAPPDAMARRV
jgi:hypothetical protein